MSLVSYPLPLSPIVEVIKQFLSDKNSIKMVFFLAILLSKQLSLTLWHLNRLNKIALITHETDNTVGGDVFPYTLNPIASDLQRLSTCHIIHDARSCSAIIIVPCHMPQFFITCSVPQLQFDLLLLWFSIVFRWSYIDFYLSKCGTNCRLELIWHSSMLYWLKNCWFSDAYIPTEDNFKALHIFVLLFL